MGRVKITEHKACLGLYIKTHYLRVILPEEKQTSWVNDIKYALSSKTVQTDMLDLLIGNLNHAAHVIPPARYLLTRYANY